MNGMIVDASVVASWFLIDEMDVYSECVLDRIQKGEPMFVPSLWLLEITNVLFNAERRKRIDKKHRDSALDAIERLPVMICTAPTLADLKILRTYAAKYQLTAYDAEYLRVAREMNLPLATQDNALLDAARREKLQFV